MYYLYTMNQCFSCMVIKTYMSIYEIEHVEYNLDENPEKITDVTDINPQFDGRIPQLIEDGDLIGGSEDILLHFGVDQEELHHLFDLIKDKIKDKYDRDLHEEDMSVLPQSQESS